ncbi:PorP/SprF family type IX secretion system membrane protein [Sporocytophaga myxococcoides]|uniref:PorP/SprF family type IX secretion system membrane protein n=1 Tax=Sporocytophaga myxococcoides TaxID=153721 RepID=UPI000426D1C5|nr:type IX secretion system membrane protein PorP/SprF [Sporocytophaga myxococcoides]
MKRIKLSVFFFLIFVSAGFAQQDAQFSQYMFNTLYYNPGFAGTEGLTRFTLLHRIQWLAYQPTQYKGSAPYSTVLSGSSLLPFFNKRLGLGVHLVNDNLGPLNNTEFQLSGSYHFKIKEGVLGVGARAGVYSTRVRTDWYRVVQDGDPIYDDLTSDANNKIRQTKPDFGVGFWYQSKKFSGGVSFDHLGETKLSYNSPSINSKLANHLYISGSYNFDIGPTIKVTPSAFFQSDMNQLTYLFGALGTYNEKFWVGLNARQSFAKRDVGQGGKTLSNDDIILYVGVNLLKNKQNMNALRIGYAFDFVTNGVKAKKRTSHEIMLSYIVPTPWELPKPKIRTPRYRHEEN